MMYLYHIHVLNTLPGHRDTRADAMYNAFLLNMLLAFKFSFNSTKE